MTITITPKIEVPVKEPEHGPLEEIIPPTEPATDSKERVLPLDLNNPAHFFLLHKFSRNPIWDALCGATPNALPKWEYPPEPKLSVQKKKVPRGDGTFEVTSYAVWKYNMPQRFSSIKSFLKEKKGGGRRIAHKYSLELRFKPVTLNDVR